MAARLAALRGTAETAYKAVLKNTTGGATPHKFVADMMEKNKEFIVTDPAAAAKLPKQLFFTSLHRVKISSDAARAEYQMLRTTFKGFGDLSLAQASTGGIFALEVLSWFSVGEVIGRGFKLSSY